LSSDLQLPPPSPAATRAAVRRRLRRVAPWLAWSTAIALVLWLNRSVVGAGVAPGAVEVRQVTLTSLVEARLISLEVTPGDDVAAGDVLARLQSAALEAELAVARVELERLKAEIEAQGISLQDDASKTAGRLSGEAEQAALTLAQLEADEQRDRSELDQLDEQIAAQQKLVAEKLASAAALNEHRLRRAALAKKVAEYGRTLRQARLNQKAARERVAARKQAKQPRERDGDDALSRQLAPHRAAVKAQQERCLQLEAQLAQLVLTAPFAGRVGAVLLTPGDRAPHGGAVLTLVDSEPRRVVAYVDQMWAHKVRPGDTARLRPSNGAGSRRSGRVTAVGASITELPIRFRPVPTHPAYCREVYVELDPIEEGTPLPGQAFDVTFLKGERSASVVAVDDGPSGGAERSL